MQSKDVAVKRPFFGYFVVLALSLGAFCPVSFGLSCAGIFYPALAGRFGVGAGMMSYYTSLLWLGSFVALPFVGKFVAKHDARVCLVSLVAVMAADFFCLSIVSQLWQFYICAFVMGFGVSLLLMIAPGTLLGRWFAKNGGFWIGIVMAFTGIGGVVWNAVGGVLIESIGAQPTYLVFAVITALTLPVMWFCVASYPADKGLEPYGYEELCDEGGSQVHGAVQSGMSASKALGTPAFRLIVVLAVLLNFTMYMYFFVPSYISALDMAASGSLAASAAMAGQTIAKVILGGAADKRPGLATSASTVCGIVGLALFLVGAWSAAILYVAAFLFGALYGTANVVLPIYTRKAFGTADYARIYARISMFATVSSVVTGFIWGTFIEVTGGYAIAFAVCMALLALTVFAAFAAAKAAKTTANATAQG